MPSAPETLDVSRVMRDSAWLNWTRPLQNGGSPITGYTIEQRDNKKTSWSRIAEVDRGTESYKAEFLIEGYEYFFRVKARNAAGSGEPTESTKGVHPCKPAGMHYGYHTWFTRPIITMLIFARHVRPVVSNYNTVLITNY